LNGGRGWDNSLEREAGTVKGKEGLGQLNGGRVQDNYTKGGAGTIERTDICVTSTDRNRLQVALVHNRSA